jgi:hypothetical protein
LYRPLAVGVVFHIFPHIFEIHYQRLVSELVITLLFNDALLGIQSVKIWLLVLAKKVSVKQPCCTTSPLPHPLGLQVFQDVNETPPIARGLHEHIPRRAHTKGL